MGSYPKSDRHYEMQERALSEVKKELAAVQKERDS